RVLHRAPIVDNIYGFLRRYQRLHLGAFLVEHFSPAIRIPRISRSGVVQLCSADPENCCFRIHHCDGFMFLWLHDERWGGRSTKSRHKQCRHVIAAGHSCRCALSEDYLFDVPGKRPMSTGQDGAVVLDHVSMSFGERQVLHDVNLSVAAGETICVVGRSGTGKSVTLKLIIALIKPDTGHIWIDSEDITLLEGKELSRVRRKMGFLFQNAALFDFLTLYDNLALPLRRLTQKSDQEIDEIIDRVLH